MSRAFSILHSLWPHRAADRHAPPAQWRERNDSRFSVDSNRGQAVRHAYDAAESRQVPGAMRPARYACLAGALAPAGQF